MKKKISMRVVSIAIMMALMIGVFAGCGENKSSPDTGSSTQAQTTAVQPEKTVTVKFLHYQVEIVDKLNEIIDGFQKANPNIKIAMDAVPSKDWVNVISMRIASGEDMDLLGIHPVPDIRKGYPILLNNDFLMDLTNQPVLKLYGDVFNTNNMVDGKVIMIPTSTNPFGVFYNKDLFKKLDIQIPKTWPEFMAACEKIKAAGTTPIAVGAKDGWPITMFEFGTFPTIIGDNDFYNKVLKGEASFSDPRYIEIFTKFQEVSKYFNDNPLGVAYADAPSLFISQKAAMYPDGAWTAGQISDGKPAFEVGMFLMPGSDTVEPTTVPVKYGLNLAIANKSKNKDEAIKFIEYFSQKDIYKDFVLSEKLLPTQNGITIDNPIMNEVAKLASSGKSVSVCSNSWPVEFKLANRVTVWQKLYTGIFTPQQAADALNANVAEDKKAAGK